MSRALGAGYALSLAMPSLAVDAGPPFVVAVEHLMADDPAAAQKFVRRELAARGDRGDARAQLWLHVAAAEVDDILDQPAAERDELAAAEALLSRVGADSGRERLWIRERALDAVYGDEDAARYRSRVDALYQETAGDAALLCRVARLRVAALYNAGDGVAAWRAGEFAERCSLDANDPALAATNIAARGWLTLRIDSGESPLPFYDQALAILGHFPARWLRASILVGTAQAAEREGDGQRALASLEEALAIYRRLGAEVSLGRALEARARLRLDRGEASAALGDALDAVRRFAPPRPPFLRARAQASVVRAMAALHDPRLESELGVLAAIDVAPLPPAEQALVAAALAAGYANLGRSQVAYLQLARAVELGQQIEDHQRAAGARLRTLRDGVELRESENRELRQRAEADRLRLVVQGARQRALTASAAALALLAAAALGFCWRALASRRRFSALALRDELTGLPNRRAILAYADQQLQFMRRQAMPLSVAVIDLDHFKRVNDNYGHAAGDAVLKAFAAATGRAVRAQDRVGRLGGEEWLLVMPGARRRNVESAFRRLRGAFARMSVDGLPSPHRLTFSGGAAEARDGESIDGLIARADRCLYAVKHGGRDRIIFDRAAAPVDA